MWACPLHPITKVHPFFEKTNKIATKYQNLESSDPWRLPVACCPWWNFDFWRTLLKTLNIYIGSFRAPLPCLLLCPGSGTSWAGSGTSWAGSGYCWTPWWGSPREKPRDHPEREHQSQEEHHKRTGQEHHHHRQHREHWQHWEHSENCNHRDHPITREMARR